LIICLWVTALYLAGFAIARAPLWPILAILCGVASVIPHLGALFSLIFVLLFSFVGSGAQYSQQLRADRATVLWRMESIGAGSATSGEPAQVGAE
jgi:hypothetical protein